MSPLQHNLEEQYHPHQKLFLQENNQHGLVSFLSTRFIHAVASAQITRQEAMVLTIILVSIVGKNNSSSDQETNRMIYYHTTYFYTNVKNTIYKIIGTQNESKAMQVFELLVDNQLLVPFDQYYQVQTSMIKTTTMTHQQTKLLANDYDNDTNKSNSGVFVPLTKCYSSDCTPQRPSCYSPSCPCNPNSLANNSNNDRTSSSSLLRTDTYSSYDSSGSSAYSSVLLQAASDYVRNICTNLLCLFVTICCTNN